jgi:putative acetyltransferase
MLDISIIKYNHGMWLSMIVRPLKETDLPAVRQVHLAAFPGPDEATLVDLLHAHGEAVISLVAAQEEQVAAQKDPFTEKHGQVIGHILFSPVQILGGPAGLRGLGLAPVAVLPADQRQGAGTGMIQLGLKMAHLRGYDYCVVLGDPRYYTRFRFQPASRFGLENEYGVEDEFMALEFRRGVLAGVKGLVQYAAEFKNLGV